MAVTKLALANLAANIFQDTASAAAAVGVSSASTTIYEIEIDNSTFATPVYVKMWNLASGSVTVGTTDPDVVLRVKANAKLTLPIPAGWVLETALSAACVLTGGTGGTGAPGTPPTLRIAYT